MTKPDELYQLSRKLDEHIADDLAWRERQEEKESHRHEMMVDANLQTQHSLQELSKSVQGLVDLWRGVTGVSRALSALGRFGLWLGRVSIIGATIAYLVHYGRARGWW